MQGDTKDRLERLYEQAATEQSPKELLKLIDEIFLLLEELRLRLNKQVANASSQG
jgi:hypothetical protein